MISEFPAELAHHTLARSLNLMRDGKNGQLA